MIELGDTVWTLEYDSKRTSWNCWFIQESIVEGIQQWKGNSNQYFLGDDCYGAVGGGDFYTTLDEAQKECRKQNKDNYKDMISETWRAIERKVEKWAERAKIRPWGYDTQLWSTVKDE